MASFSWSYAIEGLSFEIVYSGGEYQLVIAEGTMDLNALWFSNGDSVADGDTSLEKGEKSLNMNGEGSYLETEEGVEEVTWDSYSVYSETGLKGEDPLGPGTYDITSLFSDITEDELEGLIVGVRATSVNGDDSVKLTSESTLLSTPVTLDFETGSGLIYEGFPDGYEEDGIVFKTTPAGQDSDSFEGVFVSSFLDLPGFSEVSLGSDNVGAINTFNQDLLITRANYDETGTSDEFDFVGGYFDDGYDGAWSAQLTGYNNGQVVYTDSIGQAAGESGYIEVNFNGIDFLYVSDQSSSDSLVFDNLDFNILG